ncbi:hypothetical protein GCM10009715_16740 [Paeniglutamicibacter psychrophenolicus]|uniref:Uncharacterized protein n=1 Tax=Paeniglutamicibacter psychrophenolicus TaxID=257454 RepID=A0ABS4WCJ5_9MICC|nr:hypothetical protein [Paeniglutamicibacter psychrophenolicus]MBP2373918.1 hypothetical protein [Paeniglutamicibacter psychrophenolicus]
MKYFPRRSETGIGPEALVELWRAKSQDRGWLRDSDWHCSATRVAAVMLSKRRDPDSAVRSLASRRAAQGVGIAESLTDLQALFEVFPHPDSQGLQVVFADAWVESTDLFSHQLTCWDPGSGLSNRQHFERRVHELGLELERVLERHGVPGQSLHLDVEPVPVDVRALRRLLGTLWH